MSDTIVRGRKPYVQAHFEEFASKNKKVSNVSPAEAYDIYSAWVARTNARAISESSFVKLFKSANPDAGMKATPKAHTSRMSLVEQFDTLEQYVRIMTQGVINALYVYGAPGTGKTETVVRSLQKHNAAYEYFQGGVKDTYSIAKILYENRNNKIIVFDDFDSIFKVKGAVDILKTALQDHEKRTITWADGTKRTKKDSIPRKFEFTSAVIFVSNRPRVDAALKDRSMIVNIEASKVEILEWVHLHFDTFMPKIPLSVKTVVYDFIKANIGRFSTMSYRVFKKALCDYLVCESRGLDDNYWKKVVLQNADF